MPEQSNPPEEQTETPSPARTPLKRIASGVWSGCKWTFKGICPPVMTIIRMLRLDTLWRWCRGLPGRIRTLWRSRDPEAEGAPDMNDFREVLACWGIEHSDFAIKDAIRGLWKRCLLTCIMAVIFLIVLFTSWEGRTSQILATGSCIMLIGVTLATHIWRIQVLSKRRFIFFYRWILGRR